jgi:hypothetical protein
MNISDSYSLTILKAKIVYIEGKGNKLRQHGVLIKRGASANSM